MTVESIQAHIILIVWLVTADTGKNEYRISKTNRRKRRGTCPLQVNNWSQYGEVGIDEDQGVRT